MEFSGIRAIVTGGASGIGLATARLLTERGATVSCLDLSAPPGPLHGVKTDVRDDASVRAAVAEAAEHLGGVDVLVNNAGIGAQGTVEDNTDDEWRNVFEVNVFGMVRVSRAALPHLRERRGTIVNVSSTAGKRPSTGMPHYSVMKAAVLSLSRLVADLYAGDGIRCNAVAPGPTATDAWIGEGGLADQQGNRQEVLAKVGAGRPLGRLARPDEIAAVVVFLCSERASYVTGAAWSADGGTVPIIV
ncbi:MAG TPA: SDR family oxidoreductase [Candidatus Limnocylindrales bacterium]|nr:SDR family oxidoreductase [Candidatus Limnocylindrales bacterium]